MHDLGAEQEKGVKKWNINTYMRLTRCARTNDIMTAEAICVQTGKLEDPALCVWVIRSWFVSLSISQMWACIQSGPSYEDVSIRRQ